MSSDVNASADAGAASVGNLRVQVQALQQRISDPREVTDDGGQKSMTIIATKGILDMAYPSLILVNTAATFGWDVVVFRAFWRPDILRKRKSRNPKPNAVGNPSMPMPDVVAALPFMGNVATGTAEKKIQKGGIATAEEFTETSLDMGADL